MIRIASRLPCAHRSPAGSHALNQPDCGRESQRGKLCEVWRAASHRAGWGRLQVEPRPEPGNFEDDVREVGYLGLHRSPDVVNASLPVMRGPQYVKKRAPGVLDVQKRARLIGTEYRKRVCLRLTA